MGKGQSHNRNTVKDERKIKQGKHPEQSQSRIDSRARIIKKIQFKKSTTRPESIERDRGTSFFNSMIS